MYDTMFTAENGDRPNIPNIAIVVTDGESNRDKNLTVPEADEARERGASFSGFTIYMYRGLKYCLVKLII